MKAPLPLVVSVVVALVAGCGKPSACPPGTQIAEARSRPPLSVWCQDVKSPKKARRIELFETGRKKQECRYEDGVADGKFTAWHKTTGVWLEGEYAAGHKTGKWTQHNDKGVVVAGGEYREGTLVAGAPVAAPATCETH